MNEINPRIRIRKRKKNRNRKRKKRHYPLPLTKPWGAPTSLPGKFRCRDDTFLSGRSEILFITIRSAVDTRETSTRQAKRLRGKKAKSYAFFSLPLNLNRSIPAKNELNRVWLSPSVHPYKEPILVQQKAVSTL
ncbi:hypothetical protein Lal_00042276 [Lupinus albus]|nr:hypothetical protein Lal_00042276 [Lupinus albus]